MRVEVLGGLERQRRWSRDDKVRIVEETLAQELSRASSRNVQNAISVDQTGDR